MFEKVGPICCEERIFGIVTWANLLWHQTSISCSPPLLIQTLRIFCTEWASKNKLQLVDVFTNVLRRKVFTKVLVDVFTQVLARYDKRNVFRPGGLHWLAFHSRDRCNDLNCILQYTEWWNTSREVQKYHTHDIWAPIALHCNVAIAFRLFKFVYVTKNHCIAKQFWGYSTHGSSPYLFICVFVFSSDV